MAYHPQTGKEIRIMKTETHLYKNQKTMAWLRQGPKDTEHANRFSRWYTLVSSTDLAEEWYTTMQAYPSAIVLTEPTQQTLAWLHKRAPKQQQLLFLSKAVMEAYGQEKFTKERFVNIVCLEELAPMFPHVLRNYSPKEEEALTCLSIGTLFRVQRFFGLTPSELADPSLFLYIDQLKTTYKMQVDTLRPPEPLVLIQQYFEHSKPKRAREIRKCLEQNILCPYVDSIWLLNEEDFSAKLPKSTKLKQQILGRRMRYSDVLKTIVEQIPKDTLVVFSNSDIYLTSSWSEIWSVNLSNVFLSLLRYEEPETPGEEPQLFGPRPDSQDTWVVSSNSVKERQWDWSIFDFEFGKAGCDNAINVEMLRKKFLVVNPALSLKTIHCHKSQVRNYDILDVLEKPVFLYLDPTGLHDLEPLANLKPFEKAWSAPESFSRKVNSIDDKAVKTYCVMVSREEKTFLEPSSENLFLPSNEEKLYEFSNSFATQNGVAYGYDKIYLGRQQPMREVWAKTTISHMTPCIGVKEILSAPLTDETAADMWSYMSKYLSKIFRMRQAGHTGDMWLPRELPKIQEFLQFFKWDQEVMPVMPRDRDIVGYASKVTLLEPRASELILKEEVEALRSQLRSYSSKVDFPRRVVLFQDDTILKADDVLTLESLLETAGYEVNVVYPQRSSPSFLLQRCLGVEYCIAPSKSENLFWLLPKGAKVLTLFPELAIGQGSEAHMAGACGLEFWIGLLSRGMRSEKLVELVMKSIEAMRNSSTTSTASSETIKKPKLIVPISAVQPQFHQHSGDSFREMVRMWAERGWVDFEETSKTPFVWWGDIGSTLLYDRATFDWLEESKPSYTKILCGNPDATKVKSGIQWSFWPRHPRMVEERVGAGLPGWAERKKTLVFYGRVENSIQEDHRTNKLWKACDDFDMPTTPDTPYKYTQRDYLNALADSKFGLCLAGFGPKCNREIECMALGTIPVVAPDVDMDKYAVPPQERVHYIRLTTFDPEEAKVKTEAISQETWENMSAAAHAWWKEHASTEGLFELTKKLV